MVHIVQDPATRKWGVKVVEDLGHAIIQGGASRVLLEHVGFNSPGEAMPWVQALQNALSTNRTRIKREGMVWLYEIGYPGSNEVMFSEGGWMNQNEVSEHLQLIITHSSGFPKIANPPKAVQMSMGDKGPSNPSSDKEDWGQVDKLMEDDSEEIKGAGWD